MSIKFHWPRHWAFTRRQLGCAADEKSLERKLGETHKKMYKFTSKKDDGMGQMARADQRHVQLRELLHAAKMQPMTGHDGAEPLAVLPTHRPRLETELIGTPIVFNPAGTGFELPRAYSNDARASIMRVARRSHLRGPMWEAPIGLSLGIKMVWLGGSSFTISMQRPALYEFYADWNAYGLHSHLRKIILVPPK
jgi:hypothetical protein